MRFFVSDAILNENKNGTVVGNGWGECGGAFEVPWLAKSFLCHHESCGGSAGWWFEMSADACATSARVDNQCRTGPGENFFWMEVPTGIVSCRCRGRFCLGRVDCYEMGCQE